MDTYLQIQGIKLQLDNAKSQLESIEKQNNNVMNNMMNNPIGDQLLNLSIQILNTGIQTFHAGKNISIDSNKFYKQLKKISEQINLMTNSHDMGKMQQMMQQQIMNHQFQMMKNNQILKQQPMIPMMNPSRINAIFKDGRGNIVTITVDEKMTIKQLLDKYMDKVFGYENNDIFFTINGKIIERNNPKYIKEYLKSIGIPNLYYFQISVSFKGM